MIDRVKAGHWRGTWFAGAIFLLFTFAFMPSALLGQRTYGAVDMIELGSPYRDAIERPPDLASPVQLDQLEEFPWAQSFFNALKGGDYQLWDPNAGAGVPSGTVPLKGILSPFSLGFLVLPGWYALGLKVALTLLFCQAFTYLLIRRLGGSSVVATLGALAYTFQGVNIVFIHRVSAQMVLPAMLWAGHRLIEQPSLKRAAPLSALVAWAWVEGFPSGFVYCVYLTAAWCAWLMMRERPLNPTTVLAKGGYVSAAFVLGFALAAVNLIPFIYEVTSRGILERRQYGASSHLPSIQFFGLFDLNAIGRYPEGPWWSGMNPVESISHFGMIVGLGMGAGLLAAALGKVKLTPEGRAGWSFFCGLAILGLVLNYAGGPLLEAVYRLPGIANNLVTRSRFILGLSAGIIGALSLDSFWRHCRGANAQPERPDSHLAPGPRLISALTLLTFMALGVRYFPEYLLQAGVALEGAAIKQSVLQGFGLALIAGVLILAVRRFPRWMWTSAALLAVLLFFQLAHPLRDFTPSSPVSHYYSAQGGHRVLDKLVGNDHRFAAAGRFTFSLNSGQVLGIPDLRGMALPSAEFRELAKALSPEAFAQDSLGIVIPRDAWDLSSPLLDDLAVRYFVLGTDERPFGVTAYEDLRWDEWRSIEDGFVESTSFTADGPIMGAAIPIRGSQECTQGTMTLALISENDIETSGSRPSFDVLSDWIHYGLQREQVRRTDWYWFALDGQQLEAGDPYRLTLSASNSRCRLQVGMLGTGPEVRPARQILGPDPHYPLRLVSTEQAWFYERPTAWNLVSSHTRWRAFADQASALAYAANRPDGDRDVVAYVGEQVPEELGIPARLTNVRLGSGEVQFNSSGSSLSLVVVSQNADEGWTASIDGRQTPIVKVDGALAGIFVPPGDHSVRLVYKPEAFRLGAWVSGVAALVLTGTALGLPRHWRKRQS